MYNIVSVVVYTKCINAVIYTVAPKCKKIHHIANVTPFCARDVYLQADYEYIIVQVVYNYITQ